MEGGEGRGKEGKEGGERRGGERREGRGGEGGSREERRGGKRRGRERRGYNKRLCTFRTNLNIHTRHHVRRCTRVCTCDKHLLVHIQLEPGSCQYLLLYALNCAETQHSHLILLPNAMSAVLCLKILTQTRKDRTEEARTNLLFILQANIPTLHVKP